MFHNVKRKNRARGKEKKKIRTKTERKRKKTKKERRELVQWACTNRSVSLSPPSNLTFFQKRKQGFFLWGNNHSGPTPSKPLIPMAGSFFLGDYLHWEEAFSPLWLCCGRLSLKLNLYSFKLANIILFIFSVIDIVMTVIMLY